MSDDGDLDLDDLDKRMRGAVDVLKREFAGLRAGRASASLLAPVTVNVYGADMPLNQVGSVNVPEPRMLSVQVWDKSNVKAVEKAIRESALGLNPMVDGTLVRIPIPELSEERRRDLVRVANKYAEQARVAVRNVRRDGMDQLKRMERDGDISQDDHKLYADEVQALTDAQVQAISDMVAAKEADITTV